MIKVREKKDQVNVAKVHEAQQDHIFRFWDELSAGDRRALLDQVDSIDFQQLAHLTRELGEAARALRIEPPQEVLRRPASAEEAERYEVAADAGREAFSRGRVAGVIVAGGQGTRLGFDGPKGAYPIGPVSQRPLFQIFAEHALALSRRYRSSFPLYVMTSRQNHEATIECWKSCDHFGLSAADVFFFRQRELPVVNRRGRLLLADKARLAMSPNGHGGVVQALLDSGALADMEKRGVDFVSYWQVDNPLVQVHDPAFIGYLVTRNAEAAAKVARKRGPDERVGVFAMIDGQLGVVEYTELGAEEAASRGDNGRLVFDAGNLAIHAFRREFLERVAYESDPLPFHRALKTVAHTNRDGEHVVPDEPNGVKFERFIFDAFRVAKGVFLLEVDRAVEFSPVKNRSGQDSPATSRQALSDLYAAWLEQAGLVVPRDERGHVAFPIEISPLTAQEASDLKIEPDTRIEGPFKL